MGDPVGMLPSGDAALDFFLSRPFFFNRTRLMFFMTVPFKYAPKRNRIQLKCCSRYLVARSN